LLASVWYFIVIFVSVAQPSGPCWFCLASPEVEKHLVVSVGTQACFVICCCCCYYYTATSL